MGDVPDADLGTFADAEGGHVLRYERLFPRSVETVWAALTVPERLADWLGACEVEPVVGGRFDVFVNREAETRVTGRVLRWEPPRLLEFTWRGHAEETETVVRAELTDAGEGLTRLVFTHRGLERRWLALTLPGWHQLLERLDVLLRENRVLPDTPERWRELQAAYLARYDLSGSDVDPPLPLEAYQS